MATWDSAHLKPPALLHNSLGIVIAEMKLIKADTLKIHEFIDADNAPPYAMLSHRWGDDECSYQMMGTPDVVNRAGYKKIKACCEQAIKDKLEWTWVDRLGLMH